MKTYIDEFLSKSEVSVIASLNTPQKIQQFLDFEVRYEYSLNRSPVRVLQLRSAHCLDGALFACALLNRIGFEPVVVDLVPQIAGQDDDHVLAIFEVNGKYGALAKSNYTGLRYRDAVYSSLRELAMSYFPYYYSTVTRKKTLRKMSPPINLNAVSDKWLISDDFVEEFEHYLDDNYWAGDNGIVLVSEEEAANLMDVDYLTFISGRLGYGIL